MTCVRTILAAALTLSVAVAAICAPASAQQPQAKPPNILVIMGDDIGWFNIGA